MARGRPLVTNVGFFRSHRRSASLPADESRLSRSVSFELGNDAHKANVIASQAAYDSDSIVAASRRHDRDFMHNVASKLANINTVTAESGPSQTNASPAIHTSRPPRSPRTPAVRYQVPSGIHRPVLSADENLEIATYLQRSPSTPPRSRRAVSVPPPPRPSVPRWFPSPSAYYGHQSAVAPPTRLPPVASTMTTRHRHVPPPDSVVGVAHTTLYGDIVIGIPYKKRFMFNAQHDTDALDTQSLPPLHLSVPSRVSSVPPAAAAAHHYHVAAAAAPHVRGLTQPHSRASYAGPFNVSGGGDVDDVISIKSYASSAAAAAHRTPRRSHKTRDIEEDIANSIFAEADAEPVRPSTLSKDYKMVLNRYMQSNGPRSLPAMTDNELDRKYGQVLTSMQPRMSPRPSVSSVSTQPIYSHSSLPPPGPQKPKRPAMSGTRKKLRDLLCRSKGNPHYFDDAD